LLAEIVIAYVPTATVAVPDKVPNPLVPDANATPVGNVLVTVTEGVGLPVAVAAKLNAVPAVSVTVAALVIVGFCPTVKVNPWVTVPFEFFALMVKA
jgi:hypothetical protein